MNYGNEKYAAGTSGFDNVGAPQFGANASPLYAEPVSAPGYDAPPSYATAQPIVAQPITAQPVVSYSTTAQLGGTAPSNSAQPSYPQPSPAYPSPVVSMPTSVPQTAVPRSVRQNAQPMSFAGLAQNRSAAARKREMRSNMCCPCFTIFFGFVFIISGFQLEFYASQELEEVKALRPELEFDYLGEVCKTEYINSFSRDEEVCVDWDSERNCRRHETGCEDIYKRYVSYPGGTEAVFVDETSAMRPDAETSNPQPCSAGKPKREDWNEWGWAVGEDLKCWLPAEGGDSDDVHDAYHCPNDECLKINDPSDDKDAHVELYTVLAAVGESMMGLGGLMLLVAACCCCRIANGKRY